MCTVAGLVLFHLAAGHGLGRRDLLLLRIHVTPILPKLAYAIKWKASDATYIMSLVYSTYAIAFLKLAFASVLLVDEAAAALV